MMALIKEIRKLKEIARRVKESIAEPVLNSGDFAEWAKRDYWLNRGKEEAYAEVLRMLEDDSEPTAEPGAEG
jgi:hypothetical protein